MDISAIPAVAAATASPTKSSSNGVSLNDFYKLLAAEMQYTDPLDSGDSSGGGGSSSSSYISELCTMTQISAMQAETKMQNYSLAAGMVGKTVSYNLNSTTASGKTTTTTVSGRAEAVDLSSDTPKVYVAVTKDGETTGNWIDYTGIKAVYDSNNADYSLAVNSVGKTVDYDSTSTDSSGKTVTTTIEGEITKVDITGTTPSVYVAVTKDGKTTGEWVDYNKVKTVYNSDSTSKT